MDVNKLILSSVSVEFPFRPYPCQVVYMEKVIQALQQVSAARLLNFSMEIITPRACARGKVIGRVVVVVVVMVVSTKIAISRDVDVKATRKHNESIEFGEKLASVSVKSMDTVHGRHK